MIVRDGQRGLLVAAIGDVDLQEDRLALAAVSRKAPIMRSSLSLGWLIVTNPSAQPPTQAAVAALTAAPIRGGGVSGSVHSRARSTWTRPSVGHRLAGEQGAHDVDAFAQARVAHRLLGPAIAGDVLVHRFAAAERDPEPPGKHLGERRRGLRDDRRVIALARAR